MTGQGNELKRQIILDALATQSPIGLALVDDDLYEVPKHLTLLNQLLLDVTEGKIDRLMVTMPPRHGKSELCSKYFPAWYLGTHPDDRIILTSYEADFAATWGQKVRDIFKEHKTIFGVSINDRSAARNRWDIAGHRGGMGTAGVGGPITGKGAEILIIDDPVKNAEQANSPTYREKAKEWYRSTAYTRLTPSGKVILIQTRWHEDDLGGWLLEDSDDDWTIIDLPAIAMEDDDAIGRKKGEALWPELWTLDKLAQRKRELGEYWFSAMYQQQPQPLEGGILKRAWLNYYDPTDGNFISNTLPSLIKYTGWDLAISEKETADYTCSCTVGVSPIDGSIYVLDWTRDHIDFPSQQKMVPAIQNRWGSVLIGIEDNAYQAALPQSLRGLRLPIKTRTAIKDKVTKITSTFTLFEQGIIHLPLNHTLLGEWENEYAMFPTGKHDDLLDATEMALQMSMMGSNPYTDTRSGYDYSRYKSQQTRRRR
jgi:predicted phage terminase large subunit-like protein